MIAALTNPQIDRSKQLSVGEDADVLCEEDVKVEARAGVGLHLSGDMTNKYVRSAGEKLERKKNCRSKT